MVRNTRKKLAAAGVMALSVAVALSGCQIAGGSEGGSSDTSLDDLEPIVLTVSDLDIATNTGARAVKAWMDEVTEKSEGKVTFETFYSGSLIPAGELVTGLGSGLADVGFISAQFSPEQLPVSNWVAQVDEVTVPSSYPAVVFAGLANSVDRTFSDGAIRDEFASQNLVPLTSAAFAAPPLLLCKKPITTLDAAAGVSVRTGGQPWVGEVASLDMAGVTLPFNEVYEAFQRGVVECVQTSPATMLSSGILDIGTDLMLIETGAATVAAHAVNKDTWDELPLVVQQIMFDAIPASYVEFAKGTLESYQELMKVVDEKGVTIVQATELDDALGDYRDNLKSELASMAPDSLADADEYLAQAEATAESNEKFVVDELGIADAKGFDDVIEVYTNGPKSVDWDQFEAHIAKILAPYRPE